ncbi:MAG: DNA polymerase III subunit delta [Clostridia bacterium]|nr:DNA polymerase III subunit delta [Clostridia bacterium]
MTEAEFRAELSQLKGGYLFYGDEDYLKFSYSKEVCKRVLDGSFDEFNHIVIYGEDYSPASLSQAIASLPMMAEQKLVELRSLDFKALKKDDLSALSEALSTIEDCDHTILIVRADSHLFDPGRPKSPSEAFKVLTKYLTPVEFSFPQPNRLASWILRHFAEGKISFDASLATYLVEICGHSMWTLSCEIEKLCAYAKANEIVEITQEIIDDVCCKTIEYDDFQLTNMLLEGRPEQVFETLRRQRLAHEPPNIILFSVVKMYTELYAVCRLNMTGMTKGQIASTLKIHEFKVGKYLNKLARTTPARIERSLELCRDADIQSKTAQNLGQYGALERLISTLCAL